MTARLWIDDLRPMPVGYSHHARSFAEAVALLTAETFEVVSFDHDLAKEHYSGDYSRTPTGLDIARWVAEKAEAYQLPRFRWRVHSLNERGRVAIAETLARADAAWSRAHALRRA